MPPMPAPSRERRARGGGVMEEGETPRAETKPVFMKESLRGIMCGDFVQEFPWEVRA
jgi:hypothetical protein